MKETQHRQKSYTNNKRKPLEYMVGDQVFLKVTLYVLVWM
jgi:hypothetical protein